ncbi:F420-0:gamma-glutamyl ligase-like protein [Bradyrhizobium sp. RT6a]
MGLRRLCAAWSRYIWPLMLSVLLAKSLAFAHAVQLSFLIFGV